MYFLIGFTALAIYLVFGMVVATVVLKLDAKHYEGDDDKKQDDFKGITWLWPLVLLAGVFLFCQKCLNRIFNFIFQKTST